MSELMIGLLAAVLGLLGFGIWKSHKLEDQKLKTKEAEARAEVARKRMEVVHEVREEIRAIEDEKPPKRDEPPTTGDSASRIERLNGLHQH